MSHKDPQRATTSYNKQQQPTTTHNNPQLRHKVIKNHKKLHSLVYALSFLNLLNAEILMKIVLVLVPQVRSARFPVLAPATHTMFRHYSICGGSIWKRFCARNFTKLTVKGLKIKYKFVAKSFLCACFFTFLHLKI